MKSPVEDTARRPENSVMAMPSGISGRSFFAPAKISSIPAACSSVAADTFSDSAATRSADS